MVKNEIKIDTTEAIKKIEELQKKTDKLIEAMRIMKASAVETVEAMQAFGKAASNIEIDS